MTIAENKRLAQARAGTPWKKWGPYLSERQWGTVREDYDPSPNSWAYFPHDHARSRAYRWGEDGLAGFSDDAQILCFAVALHNGRDPILKERLFGLTNEQGNHGEDVKEYYFYLDATPTHSYQRMLYKYPQAEFPYRRLVEENGRRGLHEPEFELIDTGVFDEDRYFDVSVEYAKADVEDILIRIRLTNHGPERAVLRVLPTLWFRNTWTWKHTEDARPRIWGAGPVLAEHERLGRFQLDCYPGPGGRNAPLLYTDNETNHARLFAGENPTRYVKDGINDYVVAGAATVNPAREGTKVSVDYAVELEPGADEVLRLRLHRIAGHARKGAPHPGSPLLVDFDSIFRTRKIEADAFYEQILPAKISSDERLVGRQAMAGMLWTKQYYEYDVERWLREHHGRAPRNHHWSNLKCHDIISMPDKWEYPWFATWDSAFHIIALFLVDPDFARQQCLLFLSERYQHPNGALPAYEWNFDDVNPPVMPFAVLTIHNLLRERGGLGDLDLLRGAFPALDKNFQWWLDHKDPNHDWTFQGGFLGLDNIGVFDRSEHLPMGGELEQADASGWMALFAQFMLRIALELAEDDPSYEEAALRYLDASTQIGMAMDRQGNEADEMWDEEDGFFYDVLRFPDGSGTRLKVRSLVGLLPLCASTIITPRALSRLRRFRARYEQLCATCGVTDHLNLSGAPGKDGTRLASVLDESKLRAVLARLLDEGEFLGPYGIRSLSKAHEQAPYSFYWQGNEYVVRYLPGESDSRMFGGNSNWRGPVWMPANMLILRALSELYRHYGEDLQVECPTGSGIHMSLLEVAHELARRLEGTFLRDRDGRRPVFGHSHKFQADPQFSDHVLFYEYFHGDDGSGLGASHQTGWTGLIAVTIVGRARSEMLYARKG